MISADSDARSPLAPLPDQPIPPRWQDAADAIRALYLTQQPTTFPECGRPSAIADSNAIAHILSAIDDGLTPQQAGNAIGFRPETVTHWIGRAEKEPNSAFALFASACQMARDCRRRRLLGTVEKASEKGPQHWTAGAWLLERGYGNDYKLNQDKQAAHVVVNVGIVAASDITIGGESVAHNSLPDIVIPVSPRE